MRVMAVTFFALLPCAYSLVAQARTPDWSRGAAIDPNGRANPYALPQGEYQTRIEHGKLHTLVYPVTVTGVVIPYEPLVTIFEDRDDNPIKVLMRSLMRGVSPFKKVSDLYDWLGLAPFPSESDVGVYAVPYPSGQRPNYSMGASLVDTQWGKGLTFSCATCHASRLFDKTVLGLPNKVTRANEFFILGKSAAGKAELNTFKYVSNATDSEMAMMKRAKENLAAIGAVSPQTLGLDTSLAHTALSLAHRKQDEYATKSTWLEHFPRQEKLKTFVADSKPGVWWNLKYKNRWLLDGSMVSGNPVFTNFLWNEIGRGTDLRELESWLDENSEVVKDLTTAVFSMEPPRYTDFFDATKFPIEAAKKGEVLFNKSCAMCHGSYEKAWNRSDADALSPVEKLATLRVRYHERTPVINVGTDPNRYLGMESLSHNLNRLEISLRYDIVVEQQHGYVPPPLVGIWARWPYFHNNSAPTLCAVLTRSLDRPKTYYVGAAVNRVTDFDEDCNGFPAAENSPRAWRKRENLFDATKPGLTNKGHDEGIFLQKGQEIFTPEEKKALIAFLKTL